MSLRFIDRPPDPQTILAAIDAGARAAANDVRRVTVPVVRAALPSRTGRAQKGTTGRVSRTGTGYTVTIAASSRVRYPSGATAKQVVRWLHTGTGVFGPRHRPITPRKAEAFNLPGGWRAGSVRGQPGRDYFGRARDALGGIVYRTFEDGARAAARHAEGVI